MGRDVPDATLNPRAVAAAVAVAARHGLPAPGARLLVEGSNAMVELRPYPVVARVATATGRLRNGAVSAWLATEVAVAGHAARRGAPAVAPTNLLPPGPHEHDGLALTFWRYVDHLPGRPLDPGAVGSALRHVHGELASYDGPLRPWGMYEEAGGWATRPAVEPDVRAELAELRGAVDGGLQVVRAAGLLRPVHGDAHLGNVLRSSTGPVWGDLEDAHAAPLEWDLACVLAGPLVTGRHLAESQAVVRAYGRDPHDPELLPFVAARVWLAAAWCALRAATDRPRVAPLVPLHLDWLRRHLPPGQHSRAGG